MSTLQGVLTSPRVNRWLPWVAGAILAVGVAVFLGVKYWNTAPSTETPVSNQPAAVAKPEKSAPLSNNARAVAAAFIKHAVTRSNAAIAYRLSGPAIRQGESLAAWTRDWNNPNLGVPIVPYHASANARMSIDFSSANQAQLEFLLTPAKGYENEKPQIFQMELDRIAGAWKVNYWGPRAAAPVKALDTK